MSLGMSCPFCASNDSDIETAETSEMEMLFAAYCKDCGASGPLCGSHAEAALAWNERHSGD